MILWPVLLFISLRKGIDPVWMFQFLVVLYFSISFHEFAHAWAANRNGDDTARLMGRMTLNPIPHIDPVGTLIIPLSWFFMSGFSLLGWGKPVPVNPLKFRKYRRGEIETSLAGPVSNLLLVVGALVLMKLVLRFFPVPLNAERNPVVVDFLGQMAMLNMALFFFNLLPIYPLDGSHILKNFLSRQALEVYDKIVSPHGWIILLLLVNTGILGPLYSLGFKIMLFVVNDPVVWWRVLRR